MSLISALYYGTQHLHKHPPISPASLSLHLPVSRNMLINPACTNYDGVPSCVKA
jgi:hypothetical protein